MQSKWVGIVYRILSEKDKIRILFESSNKLRHANAIHNSTICKSWYSYLKKRHLFKRYMDRVYELIYNGWGSEYLLAITSYDRIRRVCKAIDEQVSGNSTWHWWGDIYDDFYWKRESSIVNHIMAAKLYRVNKRDEPHSKYIGSCELRKSLYDKVIDGFFNLLK